jgi:hypothetical protein
MTREERPMNGMMREALGGLRIKQLRALIRDTEPGHIILPGNMSLAMRGVMFDEPWVALSGPELTILLDELEASRSGESGE